MSEDAGQTQMLIEDDVLCGESLTAFAERHLSMCCSAWSASRDTNGNMDVAQTQIAAAAEKRVCEAIRQLGSSLAAYQQAEMPREPTDLMKGNYILNSLNRGLIKGDSK